MRASPRAATREVSLSLKAFVHDVPAAGVGSAAHIKCRCHSVGSPARQRLTGMLRSHPGAYYSFSSFHQTRWSGIAACAPPRTKQQHCCRTTVMHAAATDASAASQSGAQGDQYILTASEKKFLEDNGFVLLHQVMTEQEMQDVIDPVYMKFMRREVEVPGNDLCDMSGAKDRTPDEFTVYNVMLPRIYYPPFQGNIFEKRCKSIADQLRGGDMEVDFDQIFAKRASSADSAFLWHQDAAYWPPLKSDTAAANCWLAVSNVSKENGCLRYVPGSHMEPQLRQHRPVGKSRQDSHAICTDIEESQERIIDVPAARGDVIVHHERTIHASYPNLSSDWRHAYIVNLRKRECIVEERQLGFNHSHNDSVNWDVTHKWR